MQSIYIIQTILILNDIILELLTHNLVGILIQILCFRYLIFPIDLIFTVFFAYLSHLIIDALSKITYHTPDVQKQDRFWLIWHIIIYDISILSVILFAVPYWLSLIFANIHDIWDWYILRPIQKRRERKGLKIWGKNLYFHRSVDWVRDNFFSWLPRWNYKKGGIVVELLLIIVFLIWIVRLNGFSFLI